jgi:hypothetical protein
MNGENEFALSEDNRSKLDGIVSQMVENGESDEAIKFVVSDFKGKYGLKKKGKEESVLEEPSPDSSTNIIGQTSTEADTLEQEVPERPLIYRHGDYDPLGVTQREEPKDYSQADIQEATQSDPILQSLQEYGEEPVEIDFDEGIANAITTAGLDRDVDFTESPFVGRGMSGASQRQEVDENLKEDVAWNYFQERYRQVPPDQLLLLEGALERNAPNKYAQYRLKKYRAAKDRADQEWTMPEDTREYLELKNEYGQSDEMLKLLKQFNFCSCFCCCFLSVLFLSFFKRFYSCCFLFLL